MSETKFSPEIRNQVRQGRAVKKQAFDHDVAITGRRSEAENNILSLLEQQLDELRREKSDWIDKKLLSFRDYLEKIPKEKLEEAYTTGLRRFAVTHARLFKRTHIEDFNILIDPDFLKDLISSYSYDFILSLRQSQKHGVEATTAIIIAQQSHRTNPSALGKMKREFPELADWIVERSFLYKDQIGHLTKVNQLIPRLREDFPEYEDWIITQAAVKNTDHAADFLRDLNTRIDQYQSEYATLPRWAITRAVVSSPNKIREFLDRTLILIETYRNEYPNYEQWVLEKAAIQNSTDPNFLKKVTALVVDLEGEFPEFSEGLILEAAVKNFKSAKKYLSNMQKALKQMKVDYPEFSDSAITEIVRQNPSGGYVGVLRGLRNEIPVLQATYPGFDASMIVTSRLKYPREYKDVLGEIQEEKPKLIAEFPEFTEGHVVQMYLSHRKETRDFLSRAKHNLVEVIGLFPELETWVMREAVIFRPNSYTAFLTNLKQAADDYHRKYPRVAYNKIVARLLFDKNKNIDAILQKLSE